MTAEQLLTDDRTPGSPRHGAGRTARSRSSGRASHWSRRRPRRWRGTSTRTLFGHGPRDPRPVPGQHGGAAQPAAAGAGARGADGGPPGRAGAVPRAARPRPPQVRRARRALRRRRGRAAQRRRASSPGPAWTPQVEKAWTDAYGIGRRRDARGRPGRARSGDVAGPRRRAPARSAGTSAIVERAGRASRSRTGPGSTSASRPRSARACGATSRPANAPRDDGRLEFHVRAVPRRLGQPRDRRPHARRRHLADRAARWAGCTSTATAAGTCCWSPVAPASRPSARCWKTSRAATANRAPRSSSADGRGTTSTTSPTCAACRTSTRGWTSSPWWSATTRANGGAEIGTLSEVVTRYGSWADHDVTVCGSPAMIRSSVAQMLVAGTPLDRISYDPFTLD